MFGVLEMRFTNENKGLEDIQRCYLMQIPLLVVKPHLIAPKTSSFLLCLQGTLEPASLQLLHTAEQASTHLLLSPISTSEIIIWFLSVPCLNCEAWSKPALPVTFHKTISPEPITPNSCFGEPVACLFCTIKSCRYRDSSSCTINKCNAWFPLGSLVCELLFEDTDKSHSND